MLNVSKGAKLALSMLHEAGYEAYCVGGCVRDMIMGREVNDFDITTNATPEEMKIVFKNERILETGIKHGTLTLLYEYEPVEITTYRIEGEYKDSRHPSSVSFTGNLKEDLARRDFTMNALVYNENEGILDLFEGKCDIENKKIRAIGDPYARFTEDALRILRAIRFSSTLGFEIEENTKKAMVECAPLLHKIAGERIQVELEKFLLGKNVKNAILQNYEILGILCPELAKMHGFDQRNKWHIYDILEHTAVAVENAPRVPYIRLAMLLHDTGKVHTFTSDEKGVGHFYGHNDKSAEIAREFLNKYKYDNFTKAEVYNLVKVHDTHTDLDRVLVKKRLNRMGKNRFLDLIKIQRADNLAQNPELVNLEHFDKLEQLANDIINESCFSLASLKINGSDLVSNGIPTGRLIGIILNTLLAEVIDEKLPNEREALLKRAMEIKNES